MRGSTIQTDKTIEYEGQRQLSLMSLLDVSSQSHPFYTGKQKQTHSQEGNVARFNKRFGRFVN